MKKFTLLFAVLAVIAAAMPACAAKQIAQLRGRAVYEIPEDKRPDGFRGIKWGEDITKIPGMEKKYTFDDNDQMFGYERASDKLFIGDVPLDRITYIAFKGKLVKVDIEVQTYTEDTPTLQRHSQVVGRLDRLSEIMLEALGEIPNGSNGGYTEYLWGIPNELVVILGYKTSTLLYTHLPTLEESMAYEASLVKDAQKDL